MATKLTYEVSSTVPNQEHWVVEAINYDGDGEVYVASFFGPQAEERAREYAAWKNGE